MVTQPAGTYNFTIILRLGNHMSFHLNPSLLTYDEIGQNRLCFMYLKNEFTESVS